MEYTTLFKTQKVLTAGASDLSFSKYLRIILIIYTVRGMMCFSFVISNIQLIIRINK